jgi:hypothetical protein
VKITVEATVFFVPTLLLKAGTLNLFDTLVYNYRIKDCLSPETLHDFSTSLAEFLIKVRNLLHAEEGPLDSVESYRLSNKDSDPLAPLSTNIQINCLSAPRKHSASASSSTTTSTWENGLGCEVLIGISNSSEGPMASTKSKRYRSRKKRRGKNAVAADGVLVEREFSAESQAESLTTNNNNNVEVEVSNSGKETLAGSGSGSELLSVVFLQFRIFIFKILLL